MSFDPYTEWLGLPVGKRPPDPFMLLGVHHSDSPEEIGRAADRRIQDVRDRAPWERQRELRTTISQILRARNLLLDPVSRKDLSRQIDDIPVVHFSAVVPSANVQGLDDSDDEMSSSAELEEFNFHQPSSVTDSDTARAEMLMSEQQQAPERDDVDADFDVAPSRQMPRNNSEEAVESSLIDDVETPSASSHPAHRPNIPLPSDVGIVSLENASDVETSEPEVATETSSFDEPSTPAHSEPNRDSTEDVDVEEVNDEASPTEKNNASLPPKPTLKVRPTRQTKNKAVRTSRMQVEAEKARARGARRRLLFTLVGLASCVVVLGYGVWIKFIAPAQEAAESHVEPIVVAATHGDVDIALPRDIRDTDRSFAVGDDAKKTAAEPDESINKPVAVDLKKADGHTEQVADNANPSPPPSDPVEPIAAPVFPTPDSPIEPPATPDRPAIASTGGGDPSNVATKPAGGESIAVVPLPPLKPKPTDPQSVAHGRLVRELLSRGFEGAREDITELTALANKAKTIKPQDPQADFALGLVQWKRLKYDDAAESFAAARQLDPTYRFAWQAELMLQIRRRDYEQAFETAADFAGNVGSNETSLDGDSTMAVLWLGRLAGYLSHPRNAVLDDAEKAREVTSQIAKALPQAAVEKFTSAQKAVGEQVAKEEQQLRDKLAGLQVEANEQRAKDQKEIDKEKEKLEQDSGEVKKSAGEWKKWIDKQIAEHDKALEGYSQAANQLTRQAQAASASIGVINSQIATIELQAAAAAESGIASAGQQILPRLLSRRNQLANDYSRAETQLLAIRNQVGARILQRTVDVEKYRKATGKLISKKDTLKKYEALLDRKEKQTQGADGSTQAQSRALRRRLYALETYVPFHLDVEKDRLLAELPE